MLWLRIAEPSFAAFEQCWRSRLDEVHVPTGLPGGWRTTANMLFFRQQLAFARSRSYTGHLGIFQRSAEFGELLRLVRRASRDYLEAHGQATEEARTLSDGPIFCWASVHIGGSCHPPHVHSDAAVTGTYYARRSAAAAPLCLEDPRGRSPLDMVASLETRLRYGGSAGAGAGAGAGEGGAMPPFDRSVRLEPLEGECVLFPPWVVHSVPPTSGRTSAEGAGSRGRSGGEGGGSVGAAAEDAAADALLRVSFSFNLLGHWAHTAQTKL